MGGWQRRSGPGRAGVALRDPLPWPDLVGVAQTAEDTGYEAVFVPEIAGREAFATLAGLALRTSRIRLGTGVVTVHARGVATTAMGAATVQELSGGRLVLGVGSGRPGTAGRTAGEGPVARVRRYVLALREALAGGPIEVDSPSGARRFQLALPVAQAPPIFLGALGDGMIRLAGEVADGVLLNWCTPDRVRRARELVGEGAEAAGRDPSSVTVAVYVRACLGHEERMALAALRSAVAEYASFPRYRRQFELMGLGREADLASRAAAEGSLGDVPEALVRALCLLGDVRSALERLARYRRAGADLPVVYPVPCQDPYSSVLGTVLALAPRPALEA